MNFDVIPLVRSSSCDSIDSLDPLELGTDSRISDDSYKDLSLGELVADIGIQNCSSPDLAWNNVSDLFAHFENDTAGCTCWKCETNYKLGYTPRRPVNRNPRTR